ncbi:MAG: hypothetical protein AAGF47_01060 [Planctomycetota bacterium]
MSIKTTAAIAVVAGIGALVAGGAAGQGMITDFESGLDGWSVSGRETTGPGNPGTGLDVVVLDVFGADIRNSTRGFTGDYRSFGEIELTVDIQIDSIDFFGSPVPRDLTVQLRSFDVDGSGTFASIWAPIGLLDGNGMDWTTFSAALDTAATELPDGWFGDGGFDPVTFEPRLPDGVSVQDVLASVDELTFTTFVPGFGFGFTNFDMSVDNAGFTVVPAPASAALLAAGGLAASRRRRD